MKYLLGFLGLVLVVMTSVTAYAFLSEMHYKLYGMLYCNCREELIAANNYKTNEQAFECVEKDARIKILGTILFREGSVL